MQTMDMIVMKRKRIAILKKQSQEKTSKEGVKEKIGIWGMLTSVTSNRNTESKLIKKLASSKFIFVNFRC